MSAAAIIVVVVAIAAVVAAVVWMLGTRKHPEDAASHHDELEDSNTARYHTGTERPAGPGAEADGVAGPGEPTPGPGAESTERRI